MPVNRHSPRALQTQRRFAVPFALWTVGAVLASLAASTQACTVLLPWDGYVGTSDGGNDASTEAALLADALVAQDAPFDAAAGDPDGALTPHQVPCGPALACDSPDSCCMYGNGQPWTCLNKCGIDPAGTVVNCDSQTDCLPGEKCCTDVRDGGTIARIYCTGNSSCGTGNARLCDPAFGARDCTAGTTTCTRRLDAGVSLTACEPAHDQ